MLAARREPAEERPVMPAATRDEDAALPVAHADACVREHSSVTVGGVKEVFYRGRHALKTYVCVRKSSSNAMGRLAGAGHVIQTIYILGVS